MYKAIDMEGITVLEGTAPGKTITILGGVHGNEKAGIEIVKMLLNSPPKEFAGTLVLGFGNPKAIEKDTRYMDFDLNRCFAQDGHGYEKDRAEQLKTILCETDVLIDLHATIKPSIPFLCCPKLDTTHVGYLPISKIVHGKGLYADGIYAAYADTYVTEQGGIGITIEAGQMDDMSKVQFFTESLRTLITQGEKKHIEKEFLHAYENIIADKGFTFTKAWQNFEEIKKGTLYATSTQKEYYTLQDSLILFPKKTIVQGLEACILLTPSL